MRRTAAAAAPTDATFVCQPNGSIGIRRAAPAGMRLTTYLRLIFEVSVLTTPPRNQLARARAGGAVACASRRLRAPIGRIRGKTGRAVPTMTAIDKGRQRRSRGKAHYG